MDRKDIEVVETSKSLLNHKEQNQPKKTETTFCKRRKICIIITVFLVVFSLLLAAAVLTLCFASFTTSVRQRLSDKLGIHLPGYQEPAELRK